MTTTMDLAATMDALATAASTGTTTGRSYAYPVDDAQPPCVIVGYPTEWDFDVTMTVKNAKATYPVWYVVGKVTEKATRDKVSAAVLVLKTALEAASLVIRVVRSAFEPVVLGGVTYMSVRLDCEVWS